MSFLWTRKLCPRLASIMYVWHHFPFSDLDLDEGM